MWPIQSLDCYEMFLVLVVGVVGVIGMVCVIDVGKGSPVVDLLSFEYVCLLVFGKCAGLMVLYAVSGC